MSIAVTIDLPVKPDQIGEFLEFIKGIAPDTRSYDGCVSFDIYTDIDKPGRAFFYEIWESKEKNQQYLAWRSETGLMEKLGVFLTGAPQITYLEKFDG